MRTNVLAPPAKRARFNFLTHPTEDFTTAATCQQLGGIDRTLIDPTEIGTFVGFTNNAIIISTDAVRRSTILFSVPHGFFKDHSQLGGDPPLGRLVLRRIDQILVQCLAVDRQSFEILPKTIEGKAKRRELSRHPVVQPSPRCAQCTPPRCIPRRLVAA